MMTLNPSLLKQKKTSLVEPLVELNRIKIKDNGEPLIDAEKHSKDIIFSKEENEYIQHTPHRFYARETVVEMLNQAQKALPKGHHLKIMSIYRGLEQQTKMYNKQYNEAKKKHPHWPKNILRRETNRWVHPPDVPTPPGHSTGGAVDLLIAGPDGEQLDFTSPYEFGGVTDSLVYCPTFAPTIDDTAKASRLMLIKVMTKAGFTNYAGEFWHWSYGDSCWAWRLGRKVAVYGSAVPSE